MALFGETLLVFPGVVGVGLRMVVGCRMVLYGWGALGSVGGSYIACPCGGLVPWGVGGGGFCLGDGVGLRAVDWLGPEPCAMGCRVFFGCGKPHAIGVQDFVGGKN